MEKQKVLEIKDLEVRFLTEEDTVCAVNGIDLSINQGESLQALEQMLNEWERG